MTTLISDYSTQAERNNISMKFVKDGKDVDLDVLFEKQEIVNLFVYADKNRIIQVLSNILINAIKFTKKGVLLSLSKGLVIECLSRLVTLVRESIRN